MKRNQYQTKKRRCLKKKPNTHTTIITTRTTAVVKAIAVAVAVAVAATDITIAVVVIAVVIGITTARNIGTWMILRNSRTTT